MAAGDRLQKVLARAGVASRRHAEELIAAGRVRVNGRVVTELGIRVDPRRDRIEVDGRRISAEPLVYYVFHKPRGVVTTLVDPEGRPTIAEYLKDLPARVFPIGRLDFHTSGVLLLTNDGDLAQALLHPRRSVPKTYVAKVRGIPTDLQLDQWRKGVELEPVGDEKAPIRTAPAEVEVLRHTPPGIDARGEKGTTWLKITLREGRYRQIHRMAEAVGLFVMRLVRISFAGITAEGLRPGELRPLTDKELTMLRATYLRPLEKAARRGGGEPIVEPRPSSRSKRVRQDEREPEGTMRAPRRTQGAPGARESEIADAHDDRSGAGRVRHDTAPRQERGKVGRRAHAKGAREGRDGVRRARQEGAREGPGTRARRRG